MSKTHFEISASWMQACGRGDVALVVPVVRIENYGAHREVLTVQMPDGRTWTVCPFMGGRGKFVEAPAACKRYKVATWFERDRSQVAIVDAETGQHTVAEWWDADCQAMFEDGFFQGGRKLAESVLDYARDVGLVPKDSQLG
jgi:hypothetical protein